MWPVVCESKLIQFSDFIIHIPARLNESCGPRLKPESVIGI